MKRISVCLVAAVVVASCSGGGGKKAAPPTTKRRQALTVPGGKVTKHVEILDIDLAKGEQLEIQLHPDASRIRITADARGLFCPSTRLRWPAVARFTKCISAAPNRPVLLPSVAGERTHVGFILSAGLIETRVGKLAIDYGAVDPFFQIGSPQSGPRNMKVQFTPTKSKVIGASVTVVGGGATGRVNLEQAGKALSLVDVDAGALHPTRATADAVVGKPVTARVDLDGPARAVEILMEWK
jgi:hypothetical protein